MVGCLLVDGLGVRVLVLQGGCPLTVNQIPGTRRQPRAGRRERVVAKVSHSRHVLMLIRQQGWLSRFGQEGTLTSCPQQSACTSCFLVAPLPHRPPLLPGAGPQQGPGHTPCRGSAALSSVAGLVAGLWRPIDGFCQHCLLEYSRMPLEMSLPFIC